MLFIQDPYSSGDEGRQTDKNNDKSPEPNVCKEKFLYDSPLLIMSPY